MRKALISLILSVICMTAAGSVIRDIDIKVHLCSDGSADITEIWDVNVNSGTEWYLVKDNLGIIKLSGLSVHDETGAAYRNEGIWDIDRSISQKAGRCGIVPRPHGCEVCWGIGSYGDHKFTVSYKLSNVIDGYSDFDAFHLQLVSPGLSSNPQHVTVSVDGDTPISNINSLIWGFGFDGTIHYSDSKVMMESSEALKNNSSVIVLLRLSKGLFKASSESDRSFDEVLDRAMDGASFKDDERPDNGRSGFWEFLQAILVSVLFLGVPVGSLIFAKKRIQKQILGCKLKEIDWCRDIPFDGDILKADYVLEKLGMDKQKNTIASAMILRMIKNGQLSVSTDGKGKPEISFNDGASKDGMSVSEKELYEMMKAASGSDLVLQSKEFSRWSYRNAKRVSRWVETVKVDESNAIACSPYSGKGRLNEDGQKQARNTIGFKKFLEDFTIIDERQSQEVHLWHDYLVFAALYGIADKVAKELKDINPEVFQQTMPYDYNTMNNVVWMTRNLADSITNTSTRYAASQMGGGMSRSGMGGYTSFGGGGGFHGGGFGGGSR